MSRPTRLVVVTGTGTEVGKTWWTVALARTLRNRGVSVKARKPVQSADPDDPTTDARLLADATDEHVDEVCPPHRRLPVPMAPPMAADALGLVPFTIGDLVAELDFRDGVDVGIVEGAGGLRSPLAADGDTLTLIDALDPDDVLVVAPAGLGTIHGVRSVVDALPGRRLTVALNRFVPGDALHVANRAWLADRDGCTLVTSPDELAVRWA